jgi:hypothetical protein
VEAGDRRRAGPPARGAGRVRRVRPGRRVRRRDGDRGAYEESYAMYREMYPRLRELFHAHARELESEAGE